MNKGQIIGLAIIIIILALGLAAWYFREQKDIVLQGPQQLSMDQGTTMKITSPAFSEGQIIPQRYTCDGGNISPSLSFEIIPKNAKSLALIMDDPDVPKNLRPSGVFDHWIVFDIPPETKGIGEGSILPGIYGANGRGEAAYTGPCPPDREHRYFFKLYALDTVLALKQGAAKDEVLGAMEGHIIEEAQLMGRYDRPRTK